MDERHHSDANVADLLERTERARLRALVEADMPTAELLHADDYQLITPGGMPMTRSAYLDGIANGTLRYRRFEPDGEMRIRFWGTAAAVRYEVDIEVVHDGTAYRDHCWHTDIYELRDARWMAVWSHATSIRT